MNPVKTFLICILLILYTYQLSAQKLVSGIGFSASLCDGEVYTFGVNWAGQLGNEPDSVMSRYYWKPIPDFNNIISVAAGIEHCLALKSDGTVWAWGRNDFYQLGDSTTVDRFLPVQCIGLNNIIAVSARAFKSMALKSDGTVWIWGDGYDSLSIKVPKMKTGISNIIQIEAGNTHSLLIKNDSTVWTWGSNPYGQLGDGTGVSSSIPIQVSGLSGIKSVSAYNHSMAVKSDGTLWVWGMNYEGQLGNGTKSNVSIPIKSTLKNVDTALASFEHSIALQNDGSVWEWGKNDFGVMPDSSFGINHLKPYRIPGLNNIKHIASGVRSSYALENDSIAYFWEACSNGHCYEDTMYKLRKIFSCMLTTSVSENPFSKSDVTLFPNPASSMLNIHFEKSQEQSDLIIFNLLGEVLRRRKLLSQQEAVNVESFASGIYFYKIVSKTGEMSGKFVVEK